MPDMRPSSSAPIIHRRISDDAISPEVAAFLLDLLTVCKLHGFSLTHDGVSIRVVRYDPCENSRLAHADSACR